MRAKQPPPKGDEIRLEIGDEQLLDAIWDQIARDAAPNERMNTAIRLRAGVVPAHPRSTTNGTPTTSER